ncbi:MAG: valine--tRNA ligase [Clostridia bacterium]|nr:valine--tRNA ligase [Clostridia bacterium]
MDKTYEPKSFEQRLYKKWTDSKYFHARPDSGKKPFTIVMPPPNITGQLHVGHALDMTLQDAVTRYKRMRGYETLWLPGVDHASIATEVKVVEKMKEDGLTKADVGRDGFLKRAYDWKEKFGGRIVEQLKMLGSSCDWDRQAFTMDERCSKAVREVFVNLYDKGLIYRGDRIINWCPCCKTAISDAEVEYEDADSHLWHIKYPLADGSGGFITVATTRPETLIGDSAVAVNPKDKKYEKYVGKMLSLPLTGRQIPVIADDYVESGFGTGAVKITPAHDPNDFEVGRRHNLAVIKVMDDTAKMNEKAGKYCGMDRWQARAAMLADLEKEGLLVKTVKHANKVGHCYRCNTVIEPMVSKQWFVKMEPLAAPAIKVVKDKTVNIMPKRFEKVYLHWMENIRDWCISRQLWWGHRIPAYYCDGCGKTFVSKHDLTACPECGGKVHQDEDVLDTWFSSALWPFSTLGYPDNTRDLQYFYPTSLLITGYDIIFFWVARMIFSGLEHTGKHPFDEVLIHGIVRDKLGRKMSKSLGNGVDPIEIIDKYGADTLRISLVSGVKAGGDIKYNEDKCEGYRNFINKIWNAARFVLMNCDGVEIKDVKDVKLSPADMWILAKMNALTSSVIKYMDKYEVGLAAAKLYEFIRSEFCDNYIELSKTALYSDNAQKRADTVSVLVHVLTQLLKLAHPVIPFVTAEIYDSLPKKDAEDIMISPFPEPVKSKYRKQASDMRSVLELIRKIRNIRSEMNVRQSTRTALYIMPKDGCKPLVEKAAKYIEKLAQGSRTVIGEKPDGKFVTVVGDIAEVYLPLGELIDSDKERERIKKELETVESELARAEGKLNNGGFVAKAPEFLIKQEKEKVEKYSALKADLLKKLEQLS